MERIWRSISQNRAFDNFSLRVLRDTNTCQTALIRFEREANKELYVIERRIMDSTLEDSLLKASINSLNQTILRGFMESVAGCDETIALEHTEQLNGILADGCAMLLQLNKIEDKQQRAELINSLIFEIGVPVLSIFGGGWILSGSAFVAAKWAPKAAEFIVKNSTTIRLVGQQLITSIGRLFRKKK